VYAASGAEAVLPDTVTATTSKNNEKEVSVTWDTEDADLSTSCTVEGMVDGTDFNVTATVKIVEANIQYYIDCNDQVSNAYYTLDEFADLYNEVPDQKYDGTWGYVDTYGSGWADNGTDSWQSGWYAYSGQSIQYKLPIEAGDYVFTFGFKEWWNQSRPMQVLVTLDGEETVLGTTNSKDGSNNWNTPSYEYTADTDGELLITVAKASSSDPDPVLSFIKVQHVLDLDELIKAMESAKSFDKSALSVSKAEYLSSLLSQAASLMIKASTTQEQVDSMAKEINDFVANGGSGFSENEIALNDYILYLVDCGSDDTSVVADGYLMGLYQSVTDQEYAQDAETGFAWGYAANDENSIRVKGGSADGSLTGNYIYTSPDITYVSGTSGFNYSFELPERANSDYEVTVGFKNPWSSRTVDIVLEGETVADAITLGESTLVENTYQVTVSDGELNVFVHNPDRTSQYADPILSYIIVKAVPAYTVDTLVNALKTYAEAMQGHDYSESTLKVYNDAADVAGKLIDEQSTDYVAIEAAYKALKEAFENLFEVYKVTYSSITGTNGDVLYDNNGIKIQAHGGQIQQFTIDGVTKYYWYGEDKTNGYRPVVGVHLYTSTDLYNWTDEGVVLKSIPVSDEEYGTDQEDGYVADLSVFEEDEYFKNLYGEYAGLEADDTSLYSSKLEEVYWNLAEDRCVIERPKVLYNDSTGKYVMWYHADGRTPASSADYGKASVGIAISDTPVGPFKLLGTYKMLYSESANHSWDSSNLGSARDMNLFKDDDGSAYVIYSSDGNSNMYIARLNDEYTALAATQDTAVLGSDFTLNFEGASREAPAMFKYNNKYYMITSACTGWAPNQAKYAVADSPLGPWTMVGDPCTEDTAGTTYSTQSTCVFAVDGTSGKFIYMGDRWNSSDLGDSRYVWLPVEFLPGDKIALADYSDWTLDVLDDMEDYEIVTSLPEAAYSQEDLAQKLPETLEIEYVNGNRQECSVVWSSDVNEVGNAEVTGTLDIGRSFTIEVNMIPEKLIYFFDCAGDGASYLPVVKETLGDQLKNTKADQAYTEENGAGYTGIIKTDDTVDYDMGIKNAGDGIWDHGYWAGSGDTIDYSFDLEAGEYTVYTGYQEWWSTSRATEIDVIANDATIATHNFTLGSADTARLEKVSFTLSQDSTVTVSIIKTGNPDPVLSFIGIVQDDLELKDNTEKTFTNIIGRPANGFVTDEEGTYYVKNGKPVVGLQSIWASLYYFSQEKATYGEMQTGFIEVDGSMYYFGENGRVVKGVFTVDGKSYYSQGKGALSSGLVSRWASKYYYDTNTYEMLTGFVTVNVDGSDVLYHFNDNGAATKGWFTEGENKYFAENGVVCKGEKTIWFKTYHFDETTGALIKE
nr:family 43 glycosylhydrolase [Butyrivibrio sp.]